MRDVKNYLIAGAILLPLMLTVIGGVGVHILNSMYDSLQRIEVTLAQTTQINAEQSARLDRHDRRLIALEMRDD